jgi:hypothetical protein
MQAAVLRVCVWMLGPDIVAGGCIATPQDEAAEHADGNRHNSCRNANRMPQNYGRAVTT